MGFISKACLEFSISHFSIRCCVLTELVFSKLKSSFLHRKVGLLNYGSNAGEDVLLIRTQSGVKCFPEQRGQFLCLFRACRCPEL